jgi:signal transduction histidine kinase
MAPLRRALVALGIAGILLGIATFVMVAKGEAAEVPLLEATLTLLIGWSFIGTGLFAWDRRPSNLVGLLMVGVGFAWFLSEFKVADIPFAAAIGFAANSLPIAILIHLLIVFPSGRARGRLDRFFIGYAYVAGGLVAAIPTLSTTPALIRIAPDARHVEPSAGPRQPGSRPRDLQHAQRREHSGADRAGRPSRRRARAASPEDRRSQEPVWWAGTATVFLFAAALLTNLAPENGNYDDVLWYVANVVIATVPFAFLVGLLRTRLSEADLVAEENGRLDAELKARLDQLQESRARIVEAGYAARRRLERDLHDGRSNAWSAWRSISGWRGRGSTTTPSCGLHAG